MTKIRYKVVKDTVNNLCISLSVNSYPINISKIISCFENCRVVPYSVHMKKHNLSDAELVAHFGTDEGCAIYDRKKKRYLIFYNDIKTYRKKIERQRWTLAHELGHVLLNHHIITNKTKLFRSELTEKEYDWLEAEANRFASLLLANPMILYELNIKNSSQIKYICHLSKQASEIRYQGYLKWKKYKYKNKQDNIVLSLFYNFIHQKKCNNCGYGFISKTAKYCPICGNQNLKWGKGKMKYNDFVELNENGRANICPRCGNEEIKKEDKYCKICGISLYQECSNECDVELDSNARYCPICGNKTTFNQYLDHWEEEKEKIENGGVGDETTASNENDNFDYADNFDVPF